VVPGSKHRGEARTITIESFCTVRCLELPIAERSSISISPKRDLGKNPSDATLLLAESTLAGNFEHFTFTQIHFGRTIAKGASKHVYIYLRLVRTKLKTACSDRLFFNKGGSWIPFEKWLNGFPLFVLKKKTAALIGPAGYNNLLHWWSYNKKKFRFLDLPPELRSSIYIQALGPVVEPGYAAPPTCRWGRHSPVDGRLEGMWFTLGTRRLGVNHRPMPELALEWPRIERPHYSILYLNKQIYREALVEAWKVGKRLGNPSGNFAT